jgi:GMP synthase-like glutamine amidotransferase
VPVLAFRHVPFEGLGYIADVLTARRLPFEYLDLPGNPSQLVDLDRASGLIIMGGPMSANDDLAYLSREADLIRDAVQRGIPILGVCLGSQLIAKALGAPVYGNHVKEIGWFEISPTPDGAADPLLSVLSVREPVFQWHGETFDLPPGAAWLARSEACRHQAFRVGSNVYGLQFHLEVTPEMIADWCTQDANCGDMREVTAPIDPQAHAARSRELAFRVFGGWCDLLE